MRIANIIEEGKLGGPQVRIARVAVALKDRVETTIIMPNENSKTFRKLCDNLDLRYKMFWMSRITKEWKVALRYFLFFPYEVISLVFYLRSHKFDLIHISGGSWQYKGIIAGKLSNKKVIWHLNDTKMPWLFRNLFFIFSRYADAYIFASERSKQYYRVLVQKNKPMFTIQAPVDMSRFDPDKNYNIKDSSISWSNKIVIGSVANINPIKGLDIFVRAAAKLNDKFNNLVFVVVGSVYKNQLIYFKKLQLLIRHLSIKNIKFVGGHSDVRPFLKRFDIYVCSSFAESSPISVWEAMAMKKPVVSADVGDVSRYITDGKNGYIFDVGDYERLAEKLSVFVLDRKLRENFGNNAHEIALRKLNSERCADQHYEAYSKLLS